MISPKSVLLAREADLIELAGSKMSIKCTLEESVILPAVLLVSSTAIVSALYKETSARIRKASVQQILLLSCELVKHGGCDRTPVVIDSPYRPVIMVPPSIH